MSACSCPIWAPPSTLLPREAGIAACTAVICYTADMRREQAISRLKSIEPTLRRLGASALYLYGSVARDEARPHSDIDVFIDKDPTRNFGFDEFMDIYFKLKEALDTDVGYTTREGLVEFYRRDIEREAIRVF